METKAKRLTEILKSQYTWLTLLAGYLTVILLSVVFSDREYLFWTLDIVPLLKFSLLFLLACVVSVAWQKILDPYRQVKYLLCCYVLFVVAITPIASVALGYSVLLLPLAGYQIFKLKQCDFLLPCTLFVSVIKGCYLLVNSQIRDVQTWGKYTLTNEQQWQAVQPLIFVALVGLACYLLLLAWRTLGRRKSQGIKPAGANDVAVEQPKTAPITSTAESDNSFSARLDRHIAFERGDLRWYKVAFVILAIFFLLHVGLLIRIMVLRVQMFHTPTYDFGIFSQMFANIYKGLGPVTTLERDQWLSHFRVHMSPIFYVLYPVYFLFPNPSTLQIAQIVVVFSGVLPLWLCARRLTAKRSLRIFSVLLYLAMPAFTLNNLYDLHENCFLAPLLLWLAYSCLTKRWWLQAIFSLAILLVKEDAGLYLAFFGLFALFSSSFKFNLSERFWLALSNIVLPLAYFFCLVSWLNSSGAGAMTYRFSNLMLPGQTSLVAALINCVLNPTYALSGMFTYDKLAYLFLVMLPLGFFPLLNRKPAQLFLVMPLVIMNLLSDYTYQYNLCFQYGYGSTALLLFSALLALCELQPKFRVNKVVAGGVVSCLITMMLFYSIHLSGYLYNLSNWEKTKATDLLVAEQLDELPRDRAILAETFLTTRLSDVSELYDINFHQQGKFDAAIQLLVIRRKQAGQNQIYQLYLKHGYVESKYSTEELVVLQPQQ